MRTTTRPPHSQRRHRGAAFGAINTEWESIRRSRDARRTLRQWRAGDWRDTFGDVGDLNDIVDALALCDGPAESDVWLAPLVELAAGGDEIAARTVLQAMLPMAVTLYRTRRGGPDEQWNVISVLSEQIARYPLDEHPTKIAGHLRFMCRRALWRQQRRHRLPTCPLDGSAGPQDDHDGSPSVVDVVAADSDGRSRFDQLTATVVEVVSSGDLDAGRASLVLAIAAGHRVVELAEHAGCHHSVMSRRVSAATDTIVQAVNRDRRTAAGTVVRAPSAIAERRTRGVATSAA